MLPLESRNLTPKIRSIHPGMLIICTNHVWTRHQNRRLQPKVSHQLRMSSAQDILLHKAKGKMAVSSCFTYGSWLEWQLNFTSTLVMAASFTAPGIAKILGYPYRLCSIHRSVLLQSGMAGRLGTTARGDAAATSPPRHHLRLSSHFS